MIFHIRIVLVRINPILSSKILKICFVVSVFRKMSISSCNFIYLTMHVRWLISVDIKVDSNQIISFTLFISISLAFPSVVSKTSLVVIFSRVSCREHLVDVTRKLTTKNIFWRKRRGHEQLVLVDRTFNLLLIKIRLGQHHSLLRFRTESQPMRVCGIIMIQDSLLYQLHSKF